MAAEDTARSTDVDTHLDADDAIGPDAPRLRTAQAWLVVLTIGVLAGLFLLLFVFGTSNAPSTVDGRSATTSQFAD